MFNNKLLKSQVKIKLKLEFLSRLIPLHKHNPIIHNKFSNNQNNKMLNNLNKLKSNNPLNKLHSLKFITQKNKPLLNKLHETAVQLGYD